MKGNLIHLFPRKYNPFLTPKELVSVKLTGNYSKDGLGKYDVDFLETLEWTSKSIKSLQSVKPIKNTFKKGKEYMCFQIKEEYKYDYTKPQPRNNSCVLLVKVNELPTEIAGKENISLLLEKFISKNGVLRLDPTDLVGAPCQETCTLEDNMVFLSKKFLEMLDFSKKQIVLEKPLKKTERNLEFPKEWLKQMAKNE